MPQFGLRGMKIAKYAVTNGAVAYSELQTVGAAMQANIELRRAEARLYADDGLAEYMASATGGTISLGVKYIPDEAQKLLFGMTDQTRSVTPQGGNATSVAGLGVSAKSEGNYVGVGGVGRDRPGKSLVEHGPLNRQDGLSGVFLVREVKVHLHEVTRGVWHAFRPHLAHDVVVPHDVPDQRAGVHVREDRVREDGGEGRLDRLGHTGLLQCRAHRVTSVRISVMLSNVCGKLRTMR